MIYEGKNLRANFLEEGIAELVFSGIGSVNKFDSQTLQELDQAIRMLEAEANLKGVLVRSEKSAFIVGADITEFTALFDEPLGDVTQWVAKTSQIFNRFEDLPVPTVAAVNGFCLGGGLEMALSCDFRVADVTAKLGLPEVKLGIMPGFGGTVRLPRLIGADNALEWMTTGKEFSPEQGLAFGVLDAVVDPARLVDAGLSILKDAIAGEFDWQQIRGTKKGPLMLNQNEAMMSFSTAKAMVAAKAGKHYPAPHAIVDLVAKSASLPRDEALIKENQQFAILAKSTEANAQIGIFLSDQVVKGKGKKLAKASSQSIEQVAVLGAGIMGGGIAYQTAVKGTAVIMKDIAQSSLDLGLNEAAKILTKGMQRGKVSPEQMASTLNAITPTLEYSAIKNADLVIEAVVENPKIKGQVLAETEKSVSEHAVICSNTSTISIQLLAKSLDKPERFCGMHFFNPVHKMPLVEIIRGPHTSDSTIATVVAATLKMGKTPIVVNDCPGFLVNRVLFPYFNGFGLLIADGADFAQVDKVMEKGFGWPMGPAYLLDVVGMDTAEHASGVMAVGIPERFSKSEHDVVTTLYKADRYGQKNSKGFYDYSSDKRGRPVKTPSQEAYQLISEVAKNASEFTEQEVIARLMIPMANEAIRCLEEGIVASAAEADMALVYGLGFPPFKGGIFRYIEQMGLAKFVELADQYSHLGPIYQVSDGVREMAQSNQSYFAQ